MHDFIQKDNLLDAGATGIRGKQFQIFFHQIVTSGYYMDSVLSAQHEKNSS